MPFFNIVAATNENTVVTEYEPVKARSDSYQSEAELEKEFIRLLCEQGYEYLPIHTEEDLIQNLRARLEELNDYHFSDTEWERFFGESIANKNEGIVEKTRKIQEDSVQVLKRDDAMSKNIMLIDKKQVHNNRLQVINQYVIGQDQGAKHDNRYDVTVLVNGLPLVHIELKRRGVAIREAFNQINRYQRDSFWAGSGLFEYVQIFVISNGTNTKYYSNSTRFNAIKDANSGKTKKEKTSNSFEFTSFWADANNKVIPDLIDFTQANMLFQVSAPAADVGTSTAGLPGTIEVSIPLSGDVAPGLNMGQALVMLQQYQSQNFRWRLSKQSTRCLSARTPCKTFLKKTSRRFLG